MTTQTEVPVLRAADTQNARELAAQAVRAAEAAFANTPSQSTAATLSNARSMYLAAEHAWQTKSRGCAPGTPGTQIDREHAATQLHLARVEVRDAARDAKGNPPQALTDALAVAQREYDDALAAHDAWREATQPKLSPFFPAGWNR